MLATGKSLRDIQLTIFSLSYFFLCLFIVCIGNSIADRVNPNNLLPVDQRRALPDPLMHVANRLYRKLGLPYNLSDQLIGVAFLSSLLRIVTLQSLASTVLRRLLYVMATVYLLRAFTVIVTVLPNPLVDCVSEPYPNILYDAIQLFLLRRGSCGDVFFSGHTIIFASSAAIWLTYSRSTPLRILFTTSATLGAFSLVASAYHYTIDVAFGWFVTHWVWTMYHWGVTLPSLQRTWWGDILCRVDDPDYAVNRMMRDNAAAARARQQIPHPDGQIVEEIPLIDRSVGAQHRPVHHGNGSSAYMEVIAVEDE